MRCLSSKTNQKLNFRNFPPVHSSGVCLHWHHAYPSLEVKHPSGRYLYLVSPPLGGGCMRSLTCRTFTFVVMNCVACPGSAITSVTRSSRRKSGGDATFDFPHSWPFTLPLSWSVSSTHSKWRLSRLPFRAQFASNFRERRGMTTVWHPASPHALFTAPLEALAVRRRVPFLHLLGCEPASSGNTRPQR